MTTICVAKSVLGALGILTALGLSACSAKTSEQSAIGVTSDALTTNPSTSNAFAPFADTGADVQGGAAHCFLKDTDTGVFPAVYYMISLGGFGATGPSSRIEAFEPTAASGDGAWVSHAPGQPLHGIALPEAAGDGVAVTEGDGVACYYSGGTTNGGESRQAIKLTVSGGSFTLTSLGSMQVGRSGHGMQLCGVPGWGMEQRLIVYGGRIGLFGTAELEVFEGDTTWTKVTTGHLSNDVFNFASASLDASTNRSKILVANGDRGFGALSSSIDTIYIQSPQCRPALDVAVRPLVRSASGGTVFTPDQKKQSIAFAYDEGGSPYYDSFIVAGGDNSFALSTSTNRVVVTSWINSEGSIGPANAINSLVSAPALVALPGGDFALVGGCDHGCNNSLANVQKFSAATRTWSSIGTLNKARVWHIAEYLPTVPFTATGIYVTSGVRYPVGPETQTEVF